MGVNIGVAAYICILLVVLLGICFIGQAKQDAKKRNSNK
jgi:hypothetical protein